MKNNYKILKIKAHEIVYANKHILIGETHYPLLRKFHHAQRFNHIIRIGKYKDLSKIKYDEDCGE